jgi:hypothetical protein
MQKAPFQGFFVAVMHFAVRRFTLETLADPDPSVKPLNETRIAGTQSANAVLIARRRLPGAIQLGFASPAQPEQSGGLSLLAAGPESTQL